MSRDRPQILRVASSPVIGELISLACPGTSLALRGDDVVLTKLSAGYGQVWSNSESALAMLLIGYQERSLRQPW